jgi:hypothetical protein
MTGAFFEGHFGPRPRFEDTPVACSAFSQRTSIRSSAEAASGPDDVTTKAVAVSELRAPVSAGGDAATVRVRNGAVERQDADGEVRSVPASNRLRNHFDFEVMLGGESPGLFKPKDSVVAS